ncbi:MAG TPA: hypothetical protein VGL56_12870 [Fimbriimonadaceae bacterium]|jgi:hypothetical protein
MNTSLQPTKLTFTIEGISPYSSSRYHGEPQQTSEDAGHYDDRTWRDKCTYVDGKCVIPIAAFHNCLCDAAGRITSTIPGTRGQRYKGRFEQGVYFRDAPVLKNPLTLEPYTRDNIISVKLLQNSDGKRGSGTRVPRTFPIAYKWEADIEMELLDPQLTEDIVRDCVEKAGMYIGLGRWRPQNRGSNGRFQVKKWQWPS